MSGAGACAGGAFDGFLRGIDQRPFHRNCKCRLCLLSKEKKKKATTTCHQSPAAPTVGYPIRRSWSEGTLALNAHANTSPCTTSPVASAAGDNPYYIRRQKSAASFDVEDQD